MSDSVPPTPVQSLAPVPPPQVVDDLVDDLYTKVKQIFQRNVTVGGFSSLIATAMQLAAQLPHTNGPAKKDIVIQVLERMVEEIPSSDAHKAELQLMVRTFAPSIIDVVASAAKGSLNLKPRIRSFWNRLTSCCKRD